MNKSKNKQRILFGVLLILLSVFCYTVHFLIFRDAHHITGTVVAFAIERNRELHELSINDLQKISDLFELDIFDCLKVKNVVDQRRSAGGTATVNVMAAIGRAKTQLQSES